MTSRRTRLRLLQHLRGMGVSDDRVLDAILNTPRHLFVDEALASRAYEDAALPIGHGQTISRPSVVARMTQLLLEPFQPRRVLEVGTGSGYQAAILAQLVEQLYTVERIARLADQARDRLRMLGHRRVRCRHADGGCGWPEAAPFDAILLTAAAPSVPPELLDQLRLGGHLVAPVGSAREQELVLLTRRARTVERRRMGAATFVPLLSGLN
jgi:protein-L-isoaspartate(D-aspartate) O-methyltransferase